MHKNNFVRKASEFIYLSSLLGTIFCGCNTPLSDSNANRSTHGNFDSLDAELGKDRLNTYPFFQGNLESTGKITDLGLEGQGFFILRNKNQNVYFRRPASFFQDTGGYLVLGYNNTRLQGIKLFDHALPNQNFSPDSIKLDSLNPRDLTDIKIPFDEVCPPKATSQIRMARNLDSDSYGIGSIFYTQKFLRQATDSDLVVGLTDHAGNSLGIEAGTVLTFSVQVRSQQEVQSLTIGPDTRMRDVAEFITVFLRKVDFGFGNGTTAELITRNESSDLCGAITLFGNATEIKNFHVTGNRPVTGPTITKTFAVPAIIPTGSLRLEYTTDTFRMPARSDDLLCELYDAYGNSLGLESGDPISISGLLGEAPAASVAPLLVKSGLGGTTLLQLLEGIRNTFKLPEFDGTVQNNRSVDINPAGSSDNIPDGSIVIRGQPENLYSIKYVSIRAGELNQSPPSPNFFNSNMNTTQLRESVDTKSAEGYISIYDGLGKAHEMCIYFSPTAIPNQWQWQMRSFSTARILKGSKGSLTFGQDGSVAKLDFENGDSLLEVDPGNGALVFKVSLSMGGPSDFTGVTQFRSPTTLAFVGQDGYPMGRLRQISIGEDGILSASYSNGENRSLFRIPVADFPNKQGLQLIGKNSFLETRDSGKPRVEFPGETTATVIKPGALERNPE